MEIRTATRKGRSSVILEIAVLNIRPNEEAAFEAAIKRARPLIAAAPGFRTIEVHRCVEVPNRYLLLVRWEKIDDHNVGFRQSDRYHEWKKMLHHLYGRFRSLSITLNLWNSRGTATINHRAPST
jgi:heme-degrading monooxygenase HmoA